MVLTIYRLLILLLTPLLCRHLQMRAKRGKEDPARLQERFGLTDLPTPGKPPIWVHAASVGEAVAALRIVQHLIDHPSKPDVLLTTGTITSARVMAGRMPSGCTHQFAPLDHPIWVKRFLDHWKPAAAIRLESEIWPITLSALHHRKIPAALLNAHISPRSAKRWRLVPHTFQVLIRPFQLVMAEDDFTQTSLQEFGISQSVRMDNLKLMTDPLSIDRTALHVLQAEIGPRPRWVYASTHRGEEILAAQTHRAIRLKIPGLLTIIVPRHPERSAEILAQLQANVPDLNIAVRSRRDPIKHDTDLYLADTMGELGLFYASSPLAVIGRSFSDDGGGGHNPVEALQLGCYPFSGPHTQNLISIFDSLAELDGVEIIQKREDIPPTVLKHLIAADTLRDRCLTAQRHLQDVQIRVRHQIDGALNQFLGRITT